MRTASISCVPQSCIEKCSPQSLMCFLPLPLFFLGTETTGISKLSLLSLGRRVWKERAPYQVRAQGCFRVPDSTLRGWLLLPFSAGSGLELRSQLRAAAGPGQTRAAAVCAAGKALPGSSTARVMALDSVPTKTFWTLGERDRESRPPAQPAVAAERSSCRRVPDAVFRISARACRRGTGKAVQKSVAMLNQRNTGNPLRASTVSTLFALSTPCLLNITSIHKANKMHSVCVCRGRELGYVLCGIAERFC